MSRVPDFFIIGAPKAGTTALASYLAEHSGVFITKPKEPQYFTFDYPGHRGATTWDEYASLFSGNDADGKLIGDASVWYMYSNVAIEEIHNLQPGAKLIAILRRPDEMVVSLYAQQRRMGIETADSFEMAWRIEKDRRTGKLIPIGCRTPEFLYYSAVAKYAEQLERVYKYFPKDQVKIFFYEELCSDPRAIYSNVLEFLGLAVDDRREFPIVNAYADVYSPKLQSIITWLLGYARAINRYAKIRFGVDLRRIRIHRPIIEKIRSLNHKESPLKPRLEEALKREIIHVYRDDISNLMQMLGCDLTSWLT